MNSTTNYWQFLFNWPIPIAYRVSLLRDSSRKPSILFEHNLFLQASCNYLHLTNIVKALKRFVTAFGIIQVDFMYVCMFVCMYVCVYVWRNTIMTILLWETWHILKLLKFNFNF